MSEDFSSAVEFKIYFKSHKIVENELPIRGVWRLEIYNKITEVERTEVERTEVERTQVGRSESVDIRVMEVLQECIKNKDKEPLEKLVSLWREKLNESKNDLSRKGHDDYLYALRIINNTKRAIQDHRRIVKEIKELKKAEKEARKEAKKALQDAFIKI